MRQKKSNLALVAAGLGGAAVAGYGFAVGRDLWKSTKNNQLAIVAVLVLLGAVALPTLGARNLVRGHARGVVDNLLATLGSVALIAIGLALAVLLFSLITNDQTSPDAGFAAAFVLGICSTAAFALIGLVWGAIQRPARLRTIDTAKANERFLSEHGFIETGGRDITHYDSSGEPLRFREAHSDRLVFMAVGKRGKRAYIDLDASGRMTAYSGVV